MVRSSVLSLFIKWLLHTWHLLLRRMRFQRMQHRKRLSYFTTNDSDCSYWKGKIVCSVKHSIAPISTVSREYFKEAVCLGLLSRCPAKTHFYNYCLRKITKRLFLVPCSELPEKEPLHRALMPKVGDFQLILLGRKRQRLYLLPEKPCKVRAWLLSAVCGIEMNAITDFGKIKDFGNGLAKGEIYWLRLFLC